MHKYDFNPSDYLAHTFNLSHAEDLAYRRLLDFYYLHEKPIQNDVKLVAKQIRFGRKFKAIETVLLQYFCLESDNCWHHKRCDELIAKYRENKEKNQINGAKGGRPPNNPLGSGEKRQPPPPPPTSSTTSKREGKAKRFTPPTPGDCAQFFAANSSTNFEAQKFHDHFESNGWKVSGKSPMKSWEAAARNWIRRNNERGTSNGNHQPGNASNRAAPVSEVERVHQHLAERERRIIEASGEDGETVGSVR